MGAAVTPKDDFHAISLSGGKDSTCLTLLMIERGLPIDAVIWADTISKAKASWKAPISA